MKNIDKLIEIEALLENITKHFAKNNLLRVKFLYFARQYQNLSVGMIIDKLGVKKSNFALMSSKLEKEGVIAVKQGELDKRNRMLFLTEKGKKELDKFLGELSAFFGEAGADTEKAIEQLNYFLNKKI